MVRLRMTLAAYAWRRRLVHKRCNFTLPIAQRGIVAGSPTTTTELKVALHQPLREAMRRATAVLGDNVGGSIHVAVQVDDVIAMFVAPAPSVGLEVSRCL